MKKLICVLMLLLLLGLTGCPWDAGLVRKTGTVHALRTDAHTEERDLPLRTVQAAVAARATLKTVPSALVTLATPFLNEEPAEYWNGITVLPLLSM